MNKLLSILLVLCMLVTLVPMGAFAEDYANKNALELFGFPLDPDSYDTHALKKGTYPVAPKYDMYLTDTTSLYKYTGYMYNFPGSTTFGITLPALSRPMVTKSKTYTNSQNQPYSATTGFAGTGTGVEDHIARVYFSNGRSGGNIRMAIYDAAGNCLKPDHETGGYVGTTDVIEMWEVEGLLSVTAGDFDGDGYDEIAVYTPNNASETSDGSVHSNISVGIFEVDVKNKKITTKQYLDLPSKDKATDICEWEYSHNNGKKQFYCLPYVALSANDLNKDNIDDLSAIVNFSTWFRGASSSDTYSTKKIIDHNTCFASVLESYEGTQGGNLKQVIKHRVLLTTPLAGGGSNASTEHRYVLRNANLTVGDVTQEGSREIIIAANYTRVDVKDINNTSKVGSNRNVEGDHDKALCHIVGYTTYDNLKNHNTYDKNSDYHWTVQKDGNGWTYWYSEDDTDSGPITVSLNAYKHKGTGYPDTIFVGGQFFDWDGESASLKFSGNYDQSDLYHGSDDKKRETSVVWIGKAVSGNFANDVFGRETLAFPFYYKVSGKEKYTCKLLERCESISGASNGGRVGYSIPASIIFEDVGSQRLVDLAVLDGGNKTSYITYPGNDTEVYYSDVEALAIMQAPPLYEELNDDSYIGNSATGFAKSEGSGSGTTKGGTFSLGVVAGFEYEASFLGLIPCGGAEYEFTLSSSVSKEKSVEKTYTYTTGFEASGLTDAVTVFTVPYVRYNCSMYVPEYKLPTESDYNTICEFRDELVKNLANYEKTGEEQTIGTYNKGCMYYCLKYSSYVCEDNYQNQLHVLQKLNEEIDFIQKAIASFGKGGTGEWGGTVAGAVLPYHYNVPQTPLITTVDVATYDSIAEFTPGLEKIYDNVFNEGYRAGDPNTYAHKLSDLKAIDGKVLQSKQSIGSSNDGFLSNSNISSAGSAQSQTIAVEEADSSSIGWGVAVENTSVAKVSIAKAGFTVSAEHNQSYVTTTTKGQEYTGTIVGLPEGTPADYSYDWKLVSYNAKLNGAQVPVVGYLTKITKTPPPSIAQNVEVKDITDKSATITWENGTRPADFYKLSRVVVTNDGKEYTAVVESKITSDNGMFSYTLNNLGSDNTTHYVLESYMESGKYSVPTDKVIITTFPEDFNATIKTTGLDNSVIYRNGKAISLSAIIAGNEGYDTFYQWQLDKGNGWEDIYGQNGKDFKFTISPIDNGKKVRCSAVVVISGDSSYVLYSDPIVMNCARSSGDYEVDWEDNKLLITKADTAEDATTFVRVVDADGNVVKIVTVDGEADMSEYLGKDYDLRVFFLKQNLSPASLPFEG